MVTVAIAGGTGKIGLTIAEVLKENLKHKVIVLSRKVRISVLVVQEQCPPPEKFRLWLTRSPYRSQKPTMRTPPCLPWTTPTPTH